MKPHDGSSSGVHRCADDAEPRHPGLPAAVPDPRADCRDLHGFFRHGGTRRTPETRKRGWLSVSTTTRLRHSSLIDLASRSDARHSVWPRLMAIEPLRQPSPSRQITPHYSPSWLLKCCSISPGTPSSNRKLFIFNRLQSGLPIHLAHSPADHRRGHLSGAGRMLPLGQ